MKGKGSKMREKATIEKAKEDQREGRTALVGVGAGPNATSSGADLQFGCCLK